MGKLFNRTKRRRLIKQHKSERDGRIRDRIKAVLMYDNDYSYTDIYPTEIKNAAASSVMTIIGINK
jgi:hypothetical protein